MRGVVPWCCQPPVAGRKDHLPVAGRLKRLLHGEGRVR